MPSVRYPIKLDDGYPCRGTDGEGREIHFPDLLSAGDRVGPTSEHDGTPGEAAYVDGIVVARKDGLWAVALPDRTLLPPPMEPS